MSTQIFDDAFQPLFEILSDPDARFHGQTMVDELQAIESLAEGNPLAEARLFRELAMLQAKRSEPIAFEHAERAVTANEACGVLSDESLFWMDVQCAKISVYDQKGVERVFVHASRAYDLCVKLGRSTDDQLSLLQDKALWLHELARYKEALEINLDVLKRAEVHYSPDAYDLNTVLNNLAQNYYELGEIETSKKYLQRRLKIVEAASNHDKVSATLFQLAVLADEQGDYEAAEQLLKDRLARAETLQDNFLIDYAKDHLSEFYDRRRQADASHSKE